MNAHTPNLGDLLRNTIDAAAAEERRAILQEQEERARKESHEIAVLADFFTRSGIEFEEQIKSRKLVKGIQVGRGKNVEVAALAGTYGLVITDPGHKHHKEWLKFVDWANTNGLDATWDYAHDGIGIESWHVLFVKPK